MKMNYKKENEKLQSQIEKLQKEIEENNKSYEKEKVEEDALKKEICEAFNIQNPNAYVWKYVHEGFYYSMIDTDYIVVKEDIDVSNVSEKYKNARVLTHLIYKFKNGKKVDLLPLLFDKDELMSGFGMTYGCADGVENKDIICFHNLDTRDVTEVSVYRDLYKNGEEKQLVLRKEEVSRKRKSGVNVIMEGYVEREWWETIKRFDENKIVIDPEHGIKATKTIDMKLFDNQLVR